MERSIIVVWLIWRMNFSFNKQSLLVKPTRATFFPSTFNSCHKQKSNHYPLRWGSSTSVRGYISKSQQVKPKLSENICCFVIKFTCLFKHERTGMDATSIHPSYHLCSINNVSKMASFEQTIKLIILKWRSLIASGLWAPLTLWLYFSFSVCLVSFLDICC